jgi:hypothetical protein
MSGALALRTYLLVIHIAAGTAGLILGPLGLAVPKRFPWRPRAVVGYQASVVLLCFTALGLVALKPELWGLALIAVATLGATFGGAAVRRRRRTGWAPQHVRLMGSSYISVVTAFLVVNVGGPVAWVLPSLVGSPLIARAVKRAGRADAEPAGDAVEILDRNASSSTSNSAQKGHS